MSRLLLTGNAAAAWGARLAQVDYVPAFPITPQTEIIETLAAWSLQGEIPARLVMLESEHSMLTAAASAAATGVRVFTATSSQGLLYAMEMAYTVPGWRAPFVLVNVSRGLASPITLESDHTDVLVARDSGFLQIHCASAQELLDCVLIAYRVCENEHVRLPAIVNQDGFTLSFTREPVELPEFEAVRRFLPAFDAESVEFRASRPVSQAVAVLGGSQYSYFRYEAHLASRAALGVFEQAAGEFADLFGRRHAAVEAYRCDDAGVIFVVMGAYAGKARDAVDRLRAAGTAAGLARPVLLRPFPEGELRRLLLGRRAAVVLDQNLSMGKGGVLHAELASALYGERMAPPLLSYIGGLGGRDVSAAEFFEMARVAQNAAATGVVPAPRLLYSEEELREMRKLQALANAERRELKKER